MRTFVQTVILRLKAIIMTDRQLEQVRTFTKKEVMSSAINELRGYIIRNLSSVTDDDRRQELMKQQRLLAFEANAVLGDDEIAQSVQDKVLRLYSPILKRYNEQE